jgi:hypothetical protein
VQHVSVSHQSRLDAAAQDAGGNVLVSDLWDIANGKAVKFQQYTDTWQFAQTTAETPLTRRSTRATSSWMTATSRRSPAPARPADRAKRIT